MPDEAPMQVEFDPGTVDLLYDHTRGAIDRQIRTSHELDDKALQVGAVSAVVIGFGAAGRTPLHEPSSVLYGLAILLFLLVGYYVYEVLWARDFAVVDDVGVVWQGYRGFAPQVVKEALIERAGLAYSENVELLAEKTRAVHKLLTVGALEIIAVGLAVLFSIR